MDSIVRLIVGVRNSFVILFLKTMYLLLRMDS